MNCKYLKGLILRTQEIDHAHLESEKPRAQAARQWMHMDVQGHADTPRYQFAKRLID
jgi:hypothetical protein